MQRALVTGANGTIGRVLLETLREAGVSALPYVRPPAERLLDDVAPALAAARPDVVYHLAIASHPTGAADEGRLVNVLWPERLAAACREAGARLVFTSTAMVFSDQAIGPFTPESVPDAASGYGHEKRIAEERVRAAYPDARIARLGWQIGSAPGGNQMLTHLAEQARTQGAIRASRRWYPACSFLGDTCVALMALAERERAGGVYHVDSNRHWTFFEIASAISRSTAAGWRVEADDAFVFDQRLLDARVPMPELAARLPGLSGGA